METGDARTEAISTLARHLADKYRSGERFVTLTAEAKDKLLSLRAAPKGQQISASQPASTSNQAPVSSQPSTEARQAMAQQFSRMRETLQDAPSPERKQTTTRTSYSSNQKTASPNDITPAEAVGSTKVEKIQSLKDQAEECPRCVELGTLRETMVFSVGDPDAAIMFVGEAPGAEEENQQEPFVGPAGQLLTKIISAMGLDRSKVYISNICKFRPRLPNQTSNNRKPTTEEMEACLPFILSEVQIVKPKVIIALGGTAMEGLLGQAMSVARARDTVHDFQGVPLIVTYHPSYLLRNQSPSEKRKVWEDMMKAMEIVGMPISEKQRRFFGGR